MLIIEILEYKKIFIKFIKILFVQKINKIGQIFILIFCTFNYKKKNLKNQLPSNEIKIIYQISIIQQN